jgi:hypothetical protein
VWPGTGESATQEGVATPRRAARAKKTEECREEEKRLNCALRAGFEKSARKAGLE